MKEWKVFGVRECAHANQNNFGSVRPHNSTNTIILVSLSNDAHAAYTTTVSRKSFRALWRCEHMMCAKTGIRLSHMLFRFDSERWTMCIVKIKNSTSTGSHLCRIHCRFDFLVYGSSYRFLMLFDTMYTQTCAFSNQHACLCVWVSVLSRDTFEEEIVDSLSLCALCCLLVRFVMMRRIRNKKTTGRNTNHMQSHAVNVNCAFEARIIQINIAINREPLFLRANERKYWKEKQKDDLILYSERMWMCSKFDEDDDDGDDDICMKMVRNVQLVRSPREFASPSYDCVKWAWSERKNKNRFWLDGGDGISSNVYLCVLYMFTDFTSNTFYWFICTWIYTNGR